LRVAPANDDGIAMVKGRLIALSCAFAFGAQLRAQVSVGKGQVDGWIVSQRTTIDSGNGTPVHTTTLTYTGSANRLRVDSRVSPSAIFTEAATITDLSTKTKTFLNLGQKTFRVRPISATDSASHIDAKAATSQIKNLGPGGTVSGYQTTKHRFDAVVKTQLNLGDRTCEISRPESVESYMTTDSSVVTLMRQQHSLQIAATGSHGPRDPKVGALGESLRSISTQHYRASDGSTKTVTITSEVTELRRTRLDAGLFAPPSDFKEMPPLPASITKGADSTMRASLQGYLARVVDSTSLAPGETRHCTRTKH
jgi:hypothetical protein